MFLKNIHYFRAFAIINIVLVHVWRIPEFYRESHQASYTFINVSREVLFHDSTIYFIFISGFLFYYLSSKFELRRYYKNKLANVISPYVIMTSLIVICTLNELIAPETGFLVNFKKILFIFSFGKAQIQYWYIPFISLVFVVSPLLLKIPKNIFLKIVLLTSILPLFGTRTGTDLSVWQYIYFFPIYLQGIYVAMDYANILAKINTSKMLLIFITTVSSLFIIYLYVTSSFLSSPHITEAVFYIQKLSITFLIILAFTKLESKNMKMLNNFATYSFAIYFTHLLVGFNPVTTYYYSLFTDSSFLLVPASLLHAVLTTFATLYICMGLKKMLGKRSRYFIGA